MNLFRHNPARSRRSGSNRGRIHRREIAFEGLERRTMLSSGLGVGMNLGGLSYGSTDIPFANVIEMATYRWQVTSARSPGYPWSIPNVPTPPLDSNGYPIGLGNLPSQGYAMDTFVFDNQGQHYPTGTYTLTFDGSGTIAIGDFVDPVQTFTQGGGTGQPRNVNISATSPWGIIIAITSSNPTDYVRNIRLVLPGLQSTYQTQPFNPQYLGALQSFSTLRFIDQMLPDFSSATTSDGQSGELTWAERTPPTYFTQAAPAGISVEDMVALCNTLQENMWVTMPVNGDSSYEANFADYVRDNLDPGLKVYVEYGDELWNSSYQYEYNYVHSYGIANGLNQPQAMADLTTDNCWDIWLQAFAGQTGRMSRVVAAQFANPWTFNQEIARLVATSSPSDPDHGFDVIAGGAYFTPNTSSFNSQTTVQQFEAAEMANLTGPFAQQLQGLAAMRDTWEQQLNQNIPMVMYEGGEQVAASSSTPWYNAYLAAQTDPGQYPVITAFLNELENAGATELNYYNFCQTPNPWGEYGSMDYLGEPSSLTPKYNALVDFINSPSLAVAITPPIATAGSTESFTVTALGQDDSGIDTGYTGTVQFTSTDPHAILPAPYTFTAADAGVHTFNIVFETVGTQSTTITDVADGLSRMATGIMVQPGAASSFAVTGFPNPDVAGTLQNVTVTAYDACGNVATGYTGTVQLSTGDPQGRVEATYTFTAANAGTAKLSAILRTAGTQWISATDTSVSSVTGTESGIQVEPVAASTFTLSGFPSPDTAGAGHNVTVTAYDAYGNVATGYVGTVEFTSSDSQALLPAAYTFTAADAGVHTFAVTLFTAGNQSFTVADKATGKPKGVQWVSVQPAAAHSVQLSGFPATDTAGVWHIAAVAAYDAYGNVATGYTGTVRFSSSDPNAQLPPNFTFAAANAGKASFWVYLKTAGTRWITVTDTSTSSLTSSESGIQVEPAAASTFTLSGFPSPDTAGAGHNVTVTAYDAYGNVATGYVGTVEFTSSDSQALLPAAYTFTAADAGVHTFAVTLFTAGNQSFTVADKATGKPKSVQWVSVQPAAAHSVQLSGFPATDTAGVWHIAAVAAYDAYGNVATGYTGTVRFSSSDPNAQLPPNFTFAAANAGKASFWVYLKTAGTRWITVTDTSTSSLTSSESGIQVEPAAASTFTLSGFPSPDTAGAGHNVTVTAYDAYGNVATGYVGTVEFTSSDSQALLPAAYTFTAADAGVYTFSITLFTTGTQWFAVADTMTSSIKGKTTVTVNSSGT